MPYRTFVRIMKLPNKRSEVIDMNKYDAQKLLPKTEFFRGLLPSRTAFKFPILMQMPPRQIDFYLKQAFNRKKPITIQLNPSAHYPHFRETKGIITHWAVNDNKLFLTDRNKISIVELTKIRHIRLAQL